MFETIEKHLLWVLAALVAVGPAAGMLFDLGEGQPAFTVTAAHPIAYLILACLLLSIGFALGKKLK